MKRRYLLLPLPALLMILISVWWLQPGKFNQAEAALAEYQVEKLTCGSCVQKINDALQVIPGVGTVDVSLTSARSRVEFDPSQTDSQTIAAAITAAGYPASLRTELSPQEYVALRQEEAQLGAKYVARVGSRLLSRAEFEQALKLRLGDQEASPALIEQLRKGLWKDLLQREVLLGAAEAQGVLVQPGEVDQRLEQLRLQHAGLDQLVEQRFGGQELFRTQLRNDMTIEKTMEESVLSGMTDPGLRQLKLQQWYAGLVEKTEVVVFDPQLKQATASGGGCGSGGGGCCAKS